MVRKTNRPRFLFSSYLIGMVAAFTSAGVLDYLCFDEAVQARETAIRQAHRAVLKSHDDYLHERLCQETQKSRELAAAHAADEVRSYADKLNELAGLAAARQKLLDSKNRQLQQLAGRERQVAALERSVRELEVRNAGLNDQLAMKGASGASSQQVSTSVQSMRAEFARRIAAEAAGRKKPKGPVYLNTPRGRVILSPAK